MRQLRTLLLVLVAWMAAACMVSAGPAATPQLRYVVIITRHGVRSPTWTRDRLNQYSSDPWPDWGVPPGYLTPHGRVLMQLMGTYYRAWLLRENLLGPQGCVDAGRIYIHVDTDQRTLETGRALAETLLPGCTLAVHSVPEGSHDPIFSPGGAGFATPDMDIASREIQERLGDNAAHFLALHRPAFEALQSVLVDGGSPPQKLIEPPDGLSITKTERSIQLSDALSVGASLGESLMLEYADGMQGKDLGWGRLDTDKLMRILELHALSSDLTRRTPYLARTRGSNLLEHVLLSMEQAETGKAVPGALGATGTAVLILSGHDTNLANISGMLGLSWKLPGYLPDDTPPGGALIFSLWQERSDGGKYSVRTHYVAQTLEQMRSATPLALAAPPAMQEVSLACSDAARGGNSCSWDSFADVIQKAIDNRFVLGLTAAPTAQGPEPSAGK